MLGVPSFDPDASPEPSQGTLGRHWSVHDCNVFPQTVLLGDLRLADVQRRLHEEGIDVSGVSSCKLPHAWLVYRQYFTVVC